MGRSSAGGGDQRPDAVVRPGGPHPPRTGRRTALPGRARRVAYSDISGRGERGADHTEAHRDPDSGRARTERVVKPVAGATAACQGSVRSSGSTKFDVGASREDVDGPS